ILTRFCETVMPDGPVSHQEMVRNLQNSSLRKRDTLAAMAQVLLDDGFAPAFVAGLLGNIIEEGDCGRFESSAYLSNPDAEPDYLVYMDENYDYRDKYSYRLIYEGISLQEVYAMVLELGPAGANGRGSCFGLGCMQWTSYNRIKRLLENYLEAADGADTITLAQVQEAEGITISYELRNTHKKVYTDWQTANPEQDTEEAAYDAGVKVCTSYGIPVGYNTPEVQEKRGGNAAQVYAVMLGES
ncbi:MAG: phage tail tip lysozyme, partial [Evtepia gabavorous]